MLWAANWSEEKLHVQLLLIIGLYAEKFGAAGRSTTWYAPQLGAPFVSVEVGATAPAGAIARVEVRMKAAPAFAVRGGYRLRVGVVSTLLFLKVTGTLRGPSATRARRGALTPAMGA